VTEQWDVPGADPDFTVPRPGWRSYEVDGQVFYVPAGVSYHYQTRLWRSTFRYVSHYFHTPQQAYHDLMDRKRQVASEPWRPRAPLKKRIDTGVSGMRIHIANTKGRYYVSVLVAQTLTTGNCAPRIGHINAVDLTQQWLDRRLCEAAAVRWAYVRHRQTGTPSRPITIADVSEDDIPTQPVRCVSIHEVFDVIAEKEQRAQGVNRHQ